MKPSSFSFCRAAAVWLGALFLAAPGLAAQQALAGPLAAQSLATTTLQKRPGCWGCTSCSGFTCCDGGYVPGYWNCSYGWLSGNCQLSSPGCGESALVPLDPDGSAQYVTRAPAAGVLAAVSPDGEAEVRNCDGVIVARRLSDEQIAAIRGRTASLTL